jgi:hypothetical protein
MWSIGHPAIYGSLAFLLYVLQLVEAVMFATTYKMLWD